jgi:hypothetical protein
MNVSTGKRESPSPHTIDEAAPCDRCELAERCASELLACAAFMQYAHTGTWNPRMRRNPTRARFKIAFANEGK